MDRCMNFKKINAACYATCDDADDWVDEIKREGQKCFEILPAKITDALKWTLEHQIEDISKADWEKVWKQEDCAKKLETTWDDYKKTDPYKNLSDQKKDKAKHSAKFMIAYIGKEWPEFA